MGSGTFLIGLLDADESPGVAAEDFDGPHGDTLRTWQELGFVGREPGWNPVAGCPHCDEGMPYRIGERHLCPRCLSDVDPRHLRLWALDVEAFLSALAAHLRLRGRVQRIDAGLWQLGTGEANGLPVECFFRRRGILSRQGRARLAAYSSTLVFHGPFAEADRGVGWRWLPLHDLLRPDGSLAATDLAGLLAPRGNVRFDDQTGALWVGDTWYGEVPVGSKEYHFLSALAGQPDRFVPYADLKREIKARSGSKDTTEEATFCQNLKRRVKKWVPRIDQLIATTNKADGYRLRGYAVPE